MFRFRLPRPPAVEAPATRRDVIVCALPDGREVEVLRVRDARARRIKLSVTERGARLTLPARASLVAGDRFLAEHRAWLADQLAEVDDAGLVRLQRDDTDRLPLRGVHVPLAWAPGRFTALRAEASGGLRFDVTARAGEAALRRAAWDFYEAEARADVARWLPQYLPDLPRAPRRIQFKALSTQWGSLAPDGTMALDLSLVLGPPEAFEYVLVHELCHLIHHDHSPRYWAEVEARFPDWRDQRAWFREEGRRLKAQRRQLVG